MITIDTACIIDDDPIYIFGAKKIMENTNFCNDVIVYNNGKEAITQLGQIVNSGQKLPEIILLDINMPIMDGWQFLEEFSNFKLEKKITIFIVTSSIDPSDTEKAKTYTNVTNLIVKPITPFSLNEIKELYRLN